MEKVAIDIEVSSYYIKIVISKIYYDEISIIFINYIH